MTLLYPVDQIIATQALDPQAALAMALTNLTHQQERLIERLATIEAVLRAPSAALTLPMPPATLNEMINAAQIPGVATMGVDKFSLLVPAGGTVTATVPARAGRVTVSTAPMTVTASFYSILVTLRVWIDGHELTSTDYPYTLTGEDSVHFGQYFYSLRNLTATAVNNTANPTLITFKAEGLAVDQTFFKDFYLEILKYSYQRLRELAMVANGGKSLP